MLRMQDHNGNGNGGVGENEPVPQSGATIIIPEHALVRRIGKGSYGEVWLARTTMGTYRAVKIVRRSGVASDRAFEQEWAGIQKFEPISRSHEGFVDVLQVGRAADYFYYVMELGDDLTTDGKINPDTYDAKTLAKEMARCGRLPVERCVRLGLSLSDALTHLHERGLVHRDIKPSNIIFANGSPKLADIGLVAEIESAHSYVGTQGFIAPEGPGTARADIYSLGKVLYEASTGRDRNDFPFLPEKLNEFPDAKALVELNEVVVKACQQEREKRYRSARDMNAELVVVLNGKSLKQLHWLQRQVAIGKRVLVAGAAAALVLWFGYSQIMRERRIAAEARQRQIG